MAITDKDFQKKLDEMVEILQIMIDTDGNTEEQLALVDKLWSLAEEYRDLVDAQHTAMQKVLERLAVEKDAVDAFISEFSIQRSLINDSSSKDPCKVLASNDKFVKMLADLREQYYEREMVKEGIGS